MIGYGESLDWVAAGYCCCFHGFLVSGCMWDCFLGGRDQGLVCAGMMVLFGFKCLEMAWFTYTCFSFRFRSCLFSTSSG